ncbi:PREDICTED: zinc finger protein 681-like [Dinoponera quadriceps]|uniref:Zinc finger protein 681-like n=1 Tax=Dinoponera quadriceps TaxID=609295 RepID=A0A6P3XUD7_DINQU|nr:PREDICTED: zinc finger protein 681-like [Dinoponera quadriceps]
MGCTSDQDSDNISTGFQHGHDDVKTLITSPRKKVHKCTESGCHAIFSTASKLRRHKRHHTGERPYICTHPKCTKSYMSSSHLKRHLKTHDITKTVYQCQHCPMKISNQDNLKRHYRRRHSVDSKSKISCGECGMTFNKKFHLTQHQAEHFGTTSYKCDKCDKSFSTNTKLSRHEKSHDRSYPCPVSGCSEVFQKFSHLRTHKKMKHVTEYHCDKCNKIFFLKSKLRSHLKIHSENRMVIPCPYENCDRAYLQKCNLDYHIKSWHLGQKYYCDICSAGLKSKSKLVLHIKRHYEPKERKKNKERKKRKDSGIPKKSVISKLIGCNFPHQLEKLLLARETTIQISESTDNLSNNEQVESTECAS